jgi:DNA polymerase-3 subunit delta
LERIGFDPQALCENLQRLVDFTGERNVITREDVGRLVKRTRKDAIFELTNALADRDAARALTFAASLLSAGLHPLQILTALANQVRRLLVTKGFVVRTRQTDSPCWVSGFDFNRFKQITLPAVLEEDRVLRETLEAWETMDQDPEKSAGNPKKTVGSDLFIASNPKNAYPVFQTFLKTENYSMNELVRSLAAINRADLRLKSSGTDPATLLDDLIIDLCAPRRDS